MKKYYDYFLGCLVVEFCSHHFRAFHARFFIVERSFSCTRKIDSACNVEGSLSRPVVSSACLHIDNRLQYNTAPYCQYQNGLLVMRQGVAVYLPTVPGH